MRQSAISFESKGVTLEGVVAVPEGDVGPLAGVVICHPHPLRGGNMDNNVVLSVAYALTQSGFATLRFNFRGVGNSGGEHTEGKLEAQDALSALDVLKAWRDVDGGRVGVAGYSFGSRVVLENAKIHAKAKAIAVISPPFAAVESTPLKKSKRPVFLIAGDQDRLVQSESLDPVLDTFSHRPECRLVAGADHFWGGYEDQMAPEVCRFFTEHLK